MITGLCWLQASRFRLHPYRHVIITHRPRSDRARGRLYNSASIPGAVAQFGRAPRSQRGGHGFKSRQLHHHHQTRLPGQGGYGTLAGGVGGTLPLSPAPLGPISVEPPIPGQEPLSRRILVWHSYGMSRIRVSTTVDESLLENARNLRSELNDAALLDEALSALVAKHREAEIDAAYAAYDERPLDEADEWGDLASFREAAASS